MGDDGSCNESMGIRVPNVGDDGRYNESMGIRVPNLKKGIYLKNIVLRSKKHNCCVVQF